MQNVVVISTATILIAPGVQVLGRKVRNVLAISTAGMDPRSLCTRAVVARATMHLTLGILAAKLELEDFEDDYGIS